MLYFTSDLHLGHANAIRFCDRPFSDVEEMNRTLIQNINDTISEKDELWILGDFAYKINIEEARDLRRQIHCKYVHLVYGNHDRDYSGDHIFRSVQHYRELKTDYGKIVLFHYPIMEWHSAHYGSVHLHGHIHSTGEYNADNLRRKYIDRFPYGHRPKDEDLKLRVYDVGVDANQFCPVSLSQLAKLMDLTPVRGKVLNEGGADGEL